MECFLCKIKIDFCFFSVYYDKIYDLVELGLWCIFDSCNINKDWFKWIGVRFGEELYKWLWL